jgi:ABC-type antimicrobial peptide transport system permease subunit
VLAAVGLYGVMSYSVSRRTREIGIRIALGAQLSAVHQLILRQGIVLTLIAMAIGLPGAFALAGILSSFLYGIQPHDGITFTIVPLFLTAVALIACWIPAHRATRIDPQTALRYE